MSGAGFHHPGAAAHEPLPKPDARSLPRPVWQASGRVDVTLSLPDLLAAMAAARAAEDAIMAAGCGFTSRDATGGWHGVREHAVTLSIVGKPSDCERAALAAIRAAHARGCVAVQVERFSACAPGGSYIVEEWRP